MKNLRIQVEEVLERGEWCNWLTHDLSKIKFRVQVPLAPHFQEVWQSGLLRLS